MALENLRFVESRIVSNGDVVPEAEAFPDLAMKDYGWYATGSNEPVSFADRAEAIRFLQQEMRVGDFVELDRMYWTSGIITEITAERVRVENKKEQNAWNFDPTQFPSMVKSWRRKNSQR